MTAALLGRKIGMTRFYNDSGCNIPVTVVEAGPCSVSQVKTVESDGYSAVQLAYEQVKGRRSTVPLIHHDARAGLEPMRVHREVRTGSDVETELGEKWTVDRFEGIKFVDVTGRSKGKGYAGVMKRHNFRGQGASHGVERKHRSPGSVGGRAAQLCGGKPKKGIRMSGRMGNERVTVRSLELIAVDKNKNLLLIKGPVPGPQRGLVLIQEAKRLFKSKAKLARAS